MRCFIFVALLVISISARTVFGWGADGHRIVADIATDRLTPATRAAVFPLLQLDVDKNQQPLQTETLADVASWADFIRENPDQDTNDRFTIDPSTGEQLSTGPWHYVDIPLGLKYDPRRDCPEPGSCIVEKLPYFISQLTDLSNTPLDRMIALKFVVHFTGDIHQPLHCSNRDDRGGNQCMVQFLDQHPDYPYNLHYIWDTTMIEMELQQMNMTDRQFADYLNHNITPQQAQQWTSDMNVVDWANESNALAVSCAYKGIPAKGAVIDMNYVKNSTAVINMQLEKAGVRLAAVLNKIFDPSIQTTVLHY
ncbi:MAG TPA: S1/P1 nuclease [Phycisphaerae bacterium]|nr:S1/P1 nuclease [Phycisphaerae bacterium]